ncbi:MAG: hypothetical protein ABI743_11880 [bacterium]
MANGRPEALTALFNGDATQRLLPLELLDLTGTPVPTYIQSAGPSGIGIDQLKVGLVDGRASYLELDRGGKRIKTKLVFGPIPPPPGTFAGTTACYLDSPMVGYPKAILWAYSYLEGFDELSAGSLPQELGVRVPEGTAVALQAEFGPVRMYRSESSELLLAFSCGNLPYYLKLESYYAGTDASGQVVDRVPVDPASGTAVTHLKNLVGIGGDGPSQVLLANHLSGGPDPGYWTPIVDGWSSF